MLKTGHAHAYLLSMLADEYFFTIIISGMRSCSLVVKRGNANSLTSVKKIEAGRMASQ